MHLHMLTITLLMKTLWTISHTLQVCEGLPTQMSPSNSEQDVVNSGNGNDGDSPIDAYEGNETACGVKDMSLGTKEINVKNKDESETISDNGKASSSLPMTKSQRKRKLPESIVETSKEKRVLKLLDII